MSSRIVAKLSPRDAARMIGRGQIRLTRTGELRTVAPNRALEHPARTRISSGGLLAAIGMSQIYTAEARPKARYKKIFPEDRACFNLATNPGGW